MTYRGQFFNFLVGGAQGGQSDFLGELSKAGISQQRHVSQKLVDAVPVGWWKRIEKRR